MTQMQKDFMNIGDLKHIKEQNQMSKGMLIQYCIGDQKNDIQITLSWLKTSTIKVNIKKI